MILRSIRANHEIIVHNEKYLFFPVAEGKGVFA